MLELSNAQIGGWVGQFLLPLFRIAALLMSMPLIGTQLVPVRVRLYLALAIARFWCRPCRRCRWSNPEPGFAAADRRTAADRRDVRFRPAAVLPCLHRLGSAARHADGPGLRLHGRPGQRHLGAGARPVLQHAGDPAVPLGQRSSGGAGDPRRELRHPAGGGGLSTNHFWEVAGKLGWVLGAGLLLVLPAITALLVVNWRSV